MAKTEVTASPRDRSCYLKTSPTVQMPGDGEVPSSPVSVTAGWPSVQLDSPWKGRSHSFGPMLPVISDFQSQRYVGLCYWHAVG